MSAAFRPTTIGAVALSSDDQRLLQRLVEWGDKRDAGEEESDGDARIDVAPFREMLSRNRPLSDAQRAWARGLTERLFDEPTYENLASTGRVCIGRPVPTPPVLQNLPKAPPGRTRR